MNKSRKTFFEWLFDTSNKPDLTSYKWARRTYSALAVVVLWFVWVCRVLSVYQWVKRGFRWLLKKIGKGYVENASGRPEVPPIVGELYYIAGALLHGVAHAFGIESTLLHWLAVYFIFESALWIVYYTIFRRFFELGYTIYHTLEYILTMIVLIPTQALCFARVYDMSFFKAFPALLGMGDETVPLLIRIFGYFLTAIIISMIISTFPSENVKKTAKKSKMFVLGCGDVVQKRLYPALANSGYTTDIALFDLKTAKNTLPICHYCKDDDEIYNLATGLKRVDDKIESEDGENPKSEIQIDNNSVVWVETPAQTHVGYLERFLKSRAALIVMEKPITICEDELEPLEELIPKHRRRLFFLSYYVLEKALPLSYLAAIASNDEKRAKYYKKYLDIGSDNLIVNWHGILGKLQEVSVYIHEGVDTREWVTDNRKGGHLFETFLHNVLIASLFCGSADTWENVQLTDADYTLPTHEIAMKATAKGNVPIDLSMIKNSANRRRGATLRFENGVIEADFEEQTVTVQFENLKITEKISVKQEYRGKYAVMTDLVGRVISSEFPSSMVDGLDNQLEALRFLHNEKRKLKQTPLFREL